MSCQLGPFATRLNLLSKIVRLNLTYLHSRHIIRLSVLTKQARTGTVIEYVSYFTDTSRFNLVISGTCRLDSTTFNEVSIVKMLIIPRKRDLTSCLLWCRISNGFHHSEMGCAHRRLALLHGHLDKWCDLFSAHPVKAWVVGVDWGIRIYG